MDRSVPGWHGVVPFGGDSLAGRGEDSPRRLVRKWAARRNIPTPHLSGSKTSCLTNVIGHYHNGTGTTRTMVITESGPAHQRAPNGHPTGGICSTPTRPPGGFDVRNEWVRFGGAVRRRKKESRRLGGPSRVRSVV